MNSRIDMEAAKSRFKDYISSYDKNDPKIKLKIAHTYRVMRLCRLLAESMELPEEKADLAALIGLLHDIGRFEQLRLTDSFDDSIIPHAKCSLMVLFDQGRLRDFIEIKEYDTVIYESIKNHGVFRVEEGLSGDVLLYTELIRDADKLDNFHTKLVEDMETMLDVGMEELSGEFVSDYAYETFMDSRPLENAKRETHLDMWVSYIGYMFDLNLPQSFVYVKEHDYVNRLVDRVPYRHARTKERMDQMRRLMLEFVEGKAAACREK